jgi:hypothetical protein
MIFVVIDPARILPDSVKKIIYQLSTDGSVNFRYIYEELKKVSLTQDLKAELGMLVASKIISIFKCGAWEDLRGATELGKFLDLEKIKLTGKWAALFGEYYRSYSYYFLIDLSPSLINGEYWDSDERKYVKYDKMAFARKMLRKKKVPEEKLTDRYVECLWNVRELLILLHQNNAVLSDTPSLESVLAIVEPKRQLEGWR